ncbi:hypothetical protein K505DRAFT_295874 [Melanomma pulvis-pyrius CBS 109.77]|uniref:Uncharacterized protein n=1 Tax=Melanomma pulvis-pyrius CBS 109.77 TaxID=1314802 RepID=A0A6A6XQQ2_9PLEO|nr:hypothetical protein K505DRAFT_295874 [Melanomma pulvis-pyrius CBS 109.77]
MEIGLAIFGGVAAGCTLSAEILRLSRSLRKAIKSIRYARREISKTVRALGADPKYEYSLVETFTAHVRWYFSKSSVACLRASLSVARECMNGFTNIRCIEKLDEQLRYLKRSVREGNRQALEAKLRMTVEERVEILEQRM